MPLQGRAALVGVAELPSVRRYDGPRRFHLEQWADLAAAALADAGIDSRQVDGLVSYGINESTDFVPSTIAEYCGWSVNFGERVDLGGLSAVAAVWRAAAAIEMGLCQVVVCAAPARPAPRPPGSQPGAGRRATAGLGASSGRWGSPQAEFDIPYGNVAQNVGYGLIAQRYGHEYGYDPKATAKVVVDQRASACANPDAVFFGRPLTVEDVLASRLIADPLRLLEIVMPCHGGAAVVVADRDVARRSSHRPVFVTGCGERITGKTPTYSPDLLETPMREAAHQAFTMAGIDRRDIDAVQLYDCYSITVVMTIEGAGFCGPGEGMGFVADHDLSYRGSFPCNTNGGQLGFGQPGVAAPYTHVIESVRQIRGQAGERQLRRCDNVFVAGNGGIMNEQGALILQGG